MTSHQFTKLTLRLFIASVAATALVGIIAITIPTGNWEFELKVLLTTLVVAAASICGLACGGCLTRGHRVLPGSGLVLTVLAAGLLLVGVWVEIDSEAYWKSSACVAIYAVACAHLSMLFMANLAGGYRWAYVVAYQLILGLATLLAAGIVFEFVDHEAFWRATGAIAILVAAITLMIPVFHRFSREQVAAARAAMDPVFAVDEEIARVKKRLLELEGKRQSLLRQQAATTTDPPE